MKPGDLTTIASVKAWLGIPAPGSEDSGHADGLLARLISAASEIVLQHLNRPSLNLRTVTETYDAWGGTQLVLKQFPVTQVLSVGFNGRDQGPSTGLGVNGWRLQDAENANGAQQLLSFHGVRLPNERQSVEVVYEAGYQRAETRELPEAVGDAATVQVVPYNQLLEDLGVTHDGDALERIRTGAPASGEYKVSETGTYTFASDIGGDEVVIRYSFVPSAIEDAVIQIIGQKFKARDSIGVSSKNLGGQESVVFDKADLTKSAREALIPYKRLV